MMNRLKIVFLSFSFLLMGYVTAAENDAIAEDGAVEKQGLGLTVTGNQELPKSLIIVPWKNPQAGGLLGEDYRSLVEEPENLLDRDVYLRELRFDSVESTLK